ncbi:hypothetical protein JMJ77_0013246 [Colletotrichum scovillei]|uniref:Uncharacterized protein n=1 Tax=Colletotrichum scovillei TaxID=1209932 RepID=A0A9P7R7U0_9PEZI|nr:hypothetical protein JMJ77_0013246 [Colletotrichum scovillei]KAG7069540.1 hypothetical protein JMJ76_0003208 [Colletotrichum scovillei]KAG7073490.1 hypothetical protein JMJ78_0014464 [Colletotrichum scovillei]
MGTEQSVVCNGPTNSDCLLSHVSIQPSVSKSCPKMKCGSSIDSSASHVGHGQYPIGQRKGDGDDFSRQLKSRNESLVSTMLSARPAKSDSISRRPTQPWTLKTLQEERDLSIVIAITFSASGNYKSRLWYGLLPTSLLAETLALCIKLHQSTSGTNGALVLWFCSATERWMDDARTMGQTAAPQHKAGTIRLDPAACTIDNQLDSILALSSCHYRSAWTRSLPMQPCIESRSLSQRRQHTLSAYLPVHIGVEAGYARLYVA